MANSVQAAYRNSRDQEVFREVLTCDHLGVPMAVRHRDGIVYVLTIEHDGTAVFREDLDQARWNGARSNGRGDAAPGLGSASTAPGILPISPAAVVRAPSPKAPQPKPVRSQSVARRRRNQ